MFGVSDLGDLSMEITRIRLVLVLVLALVVDEDGFGLQGAAGMTGGPMFRANRDELDGTPMR